MGKKIDITGQRFGKLKVTGESSKRKGGRIDWDCDCDCGNITSVTTSNLTSGNTSSCGCIRKVDLTGLVFGELTVIRQLRKRDKWGHIQWKCKCTCGKTYIASTGHLNSKNALSCGCSRAKDITGEQFGFWTVIKTLDSRDKQGSVLHLCQCKCGNLCSLTTGALNSGNTNSCGCVGLVRQPIIQQYVRMVYAESQNITIEVERYVPIGNRKHFFDIAIIKNGTIIGLIEYDGPQHFRPTRFGGMSIKKAEQEYQNRVKQDDSKNKYCKKHNIPLCRIPYTEYDNYESIVDKFIKQNRL